MTVSFLWVVQRREKAKASCLGRPCPLLELASQGQLLEDHVPAGQQAHWVPQGPLPAAPPSVLVPAPLPRDLPEGTSLFLNSLGLRCPSSFSKDNPGLFHSMCYRAGVGNDRWSRGGYGWCHFHGGGSTLPPGGESIFRGRSSCRRPSRAI